MIVASERQYKAAYSSLGDERVQKGTKGFVKISRSRRFKSKTSSAQESLDLKDYEKYWFQRRDENWANIPMKKVYSRKERKQIYIALVTEILIHLAPKSSFNPWLVWVKLKEKEAAQLLEQANGESSTNTTKTLSKLEIIRMENIQQKIEDAQIAEITRIRNSKDSISTLIRQLSTQRAREILLIEILKKAIQERNNAEIFDILWAIENFELTKQDAPKPKKTSDIIPSVRDPSLVYDNYKNVENLLDEARKIRHRETDIIRFQLNDMSDRLPPLSPYIFDFKLDAWQIRALQFIDAGKSLVICAPTSSGKTVLSTYVALISKHKPHLAGETSGGKDDKSTTAALAKLHIKNVASESDMILDNNNNDDEEGIVDLVESDEEDDDEEDDDDEDDDYGEEDTNGNKKNTNSGVSNHITDTFLTADREKRLKFRKNNMDGTQRVLFVVPSEPLVWQVAAYFTKLLREEGDEDTKVAIVTSQMTYFPPKKFNVMPQIVVGTPMALESALTKPRGLVGRFETINKAEGVLLPGGLEHFDWAIYDEVHAIDSAEGDALQRLIRAMNCKFLALSATVGNADELLGWLERVKGDQILGVETINVLPDEATFYGTGINTTSTPNLQSSAAAASSTTDKKKKSNKSATATTVVYININIKRISDNTNFPITNISSQSTILDLKLKLWRLLPVLEKEPEPIQLCLEYQGKMMSEANITLESIGIIKDVEINLLTFNLLVSRTVDNQNIIVKHVSPLCTLTSLRRRIVDVWPVLTAEALQVLMLQPLSLSSSCTTTSTPTTPATEPQLSIATTITKAIVIGNTTIEVTPGQSYPKNSLLCITDATNSTQMEIVTLSQAKSETDTIIHIHPANKAFTMNSTCIGYSYKDLTENLKTLESYGFSYSTSTSTSTTNNTATSNKPLQIIQIRTLVNLLSHQGRFINLQRYLWSNSKLIPMSPIAAVESLDFLKQGILDNSSLSFTSKDSYRLWQEMEKLYPHEALNKYNPHNFFNSTTRITLQSTKDYEDLLKQGLKELSVSHPLETTELLYKFRIEDEKNKSVDLTELCLSLRTENMLPCLAFHLNAFEAIAIFKQLLAGIEWRQKKEYPLYYKELQDDKDRQRKNTEKQQKDLGGNEKEAEEKAKSGELEMNQDFTVDLYEPHPKFRFSKGSVMTADEFISLSDEMERFDGFPARDPQAMQQGKGKNEAVLSHALMRGLRRGIALYIDEVSSPAYRRAVQRLASQGKLGVVISDDSLAFGVNMPFRTCVFCGEMEGQLTPLMAQQMSGRAGRRGLDTQGSLVYAGARASFIRSLMIGQVANITGTNYPPRYESLFLQVTFRFFNIYCNTFILLLF